MVARREETSLSLFDRARASVLADEPRGPVDLRHDFYERAFPDGPPQVVPQGRGVPDPRVRNSNAAREFANDFGAPGQTR